MVTSPPFLYPKKLAANDMKKNHNNLQKQYGWDSFKDTFMQMSSLCDIMVLFRCLLFWICQISLHEINDDVKT